MRAAHWASVPAVAPATATAAADLEPPIPRLRLGSRFRFPFRFRFRSTSASCSGSSPQTRPRAPHSGTRPVRPVSISTLCRFYTSVHFLAHSVPNELASRGPSGPPRAPGPLGRPRQHPSTCFRTACLFAARKQHIHLWKACFHARCITSDQQPGSGTRSRAVTTACGGMPESACHRQGANASVWCFYTEQGAYGALNLEHQMAVEKRRGQWI